MANLSRLQKKMRLALLAALLGAAIFAINYIGFDKSIKNAFFSAASPFQKFFWERGQGVNLFFETIGEIKDLKRKNDELELENQGLKAEIARVREIKTENEALRKALNLGLGKEFQLLMAEAISQDPFSDAILINRGTSDGVAAGSTVITPEKVLVGLTTEVFPDFSRVGLLSGKKSSVSAQIQAENEEITGVARGQGNFEIVFDLIPQDKKIRVGDRLVTTALGNVFPRGLLIGEIALVDYSDVRPFQTARVKPAFNAGDLKIIFVVIP